MSSQNNSNFTDQLIHKIEISKIPLAQIARETGLKPQYIYAIMSGKIPNPGYEQGKELEVYLQDHFKNLKVLDDHRAIAGGE